MKKIRTVRRRFYVEATLVALTLVLTVVTLINPAWLEVVLPVDPDEGNGSLEWALTGALAVVTVIFFVVARREYYRPRFA